MSSKVVKGFAKLECEKCGTKTWHFHQSETLPTLHCCPCHPPKADSEIKVWGTVVQAESNSDLRAKEAKWKEGIAGASKPYRIYQRGENSLLTELGIDDGIIGAAYDPNKVICSFCKKVVDKINASYGTSKISVGRDVEIVCRDPLVERVITKVSAPRVTACPDCCLHIKPLVDKWGDITNQNQSSYSEG